MAVQLLGPAAVDDVDAARVTDLPTRKVTRIVSYCNGGMGGSVPNTTTTVNTQAGFRFAVRLPVNSIRWRFRCRNYDMFQSATRTAPTGKGIKFGQAELVTTGAGTTSYTGNFVGSTATTIVGSDFTIPGDGTWYASDWVTDPASQFVAGTHHLVAIGYTVPSSTAVLNTWGECFYWSSYTSALDPTVTAGSTIPTGIPLDFVIEYECVSSRSAWLVIGDSIAEGVTGNRGNSTTPARVPIPTWRNYPNLWAARNNALVCNMSLAGMQTWQYMPATWPQFFSRMDLASAKLDGAFIATGSNDLYAATPTRTLAQFQGDIANLVAQVRTTIGSDKPIYYGAIIPRTSNTIRNQANDWLASLPYGAAGFVDFNAVMSTTLDATALPADLTTDSIHPTFKGLEHMAAAMGGVVSPVRNM
ncbi:SGNH/GDSL hydrolase family protein [Nocardia nova]|uniref:SGNH/GDSL hydrolase family protein n=1 Tax=Nocardia nova TaxID=37330 RepID=UPI0018937996|nr:SGNH/GDSL hydrolase family protein [Nocardia nova]MBF6277072.1 SGNH/GDSL hydrolase family protein [Nocardia nova]